jgi:hypothetical protein
MSNAEIERLRRKVSGATNRPTILNLATNAFDKVLQRTSFDNLSLENEDILTQNLRKPLNLGRGGGGVGRGGEGGINGDCKTLNPKH